MAHTSGTLAKMVETVRGYLKQLAWDCAFGTLVLSAGFSVPHGDIGTFHVNSPGSLSCHLERLAVSFHDLDLFLKKCMILKFRLHFIGLNNYLFI